MHISIYLGEGKEAARRKAALESLAEQARHMWDDKPSIGRWLCSLADQELRRETMYYVQYISATGGQDENHLSERVRILRDPAQGVHRLDTGWLVSDTGDPMTEDQVREMLIDNGIDYPDDIPLLADEYSISDPEWNAMFYGWGQPLEDDLPLWMQPNWFQLLHGVDGWDITLTEWKSTH